MRYAISYVSNRNDYIKQEDIIQLLRETCSFNNENDITGVLIYTDGNFFQLIEGEKKLITNLYNKKIKKDARHKNLIKILEMEISNPAYDGYYCDIVNDKFQTDVSKLQTYYNHLKVLDKKVRKTVFAVLKNFIPDIENQIQSNSK